MTFPALKELSPGLSQAVLRVDRSLRATWVDPGLTAKVGVVLSAGGSLLDVLERGPERDRVESAVRAGLAYEGPSSTCSFRQVWTQVRPSADGGLWVLLRPCGVDDEIAFARALQEIARAVGEIMDVEAVCAAAVVAIVRCAQVSRAAVYLKEEAGPRRVALSDLAGPEAGTKLDEKAEEALRLALEEGEPRLGILRHGEGRPDALYAAIPLQSQRRIQGALFLCKPEGTTFSVREMDLWSAAAAQLAVAVENARLLREAQAALRIRDEFMSIASHELKTPLTPLKMSLYLMERKLAEGKPVEVSWVIKAKRQVDRLTGLVNELLAASRVELGKLTIERDPLDLGQLVAEAVEEFRAAYQRELSLTLPTGRVWVRGDRDRLDQVVVNLIENALKYSPPDQPVRVELERARGEVRLKVSDHGIGVPPADQARIFQRFFRAENASTRHFGGLGLGLFISHSVVTLHGGTMAVESEEGQGSTFIVRLPAMKRRDVKALRPRVLLLEPEGAEDSVAERLEAAGFDLAPDEGHEALRNLVRRPLDAVVISPAYPEPAARLFLEAARAVPLGAPLPVLWNGKPPEWAGADAADLGSWLERAAQAQPAVHPERRAQPGVEGSEFA